MTIFVAIELTIEILNFHHRIFKVYLYLFLNYVLGGYVHMNTDDLKVFKIIFVGFCYQSKFLYKIYFCLILFFSARNGIQGLVHDR